MPNSLKTSEILALLPYTEPFLFVDEIKFITEDRVEGIYTFKENSPFYEGHFKDNPITPGVLLTECMAQIGLVCLGIFLFRNKAEVDNYSFVMSHTDIDFYLPVLPGEKVTVISEKVYFRFQKLKAKVHMTNELGQKICAGTISGMIINSSIKINK